MVSIIMPTFNRGYIIKRAINSVLAQEYKKWELIIIDDGSTDDTEQILKSFTDIRIKYYRLDKNYGANYARNKGLEKAKGEYYAFLDSDNEWNETYLKARLDVFRKHGVNIGGVFGRIEKSLDDNGRYIVPDGIELGSCNAERDNRKLLRLMLMDNVMDTNAVVLKKECADMIDGFDEKLRRLQDWEYFIRILAFTGYKVIFSDDVLVKNYYLPDSISSRQNYDSYWEARLYIFKKYKLLAEDLGVINDIVASLCMGYKMKVSSENIKKIVEEWDYASVCDLVLAFYRRGRIEWENSNESNQKLNESNQKLNEVLVKRTKLMNANEKWLNLKFRKFHLEDAFKYMGIHSIAIYGYGKLGKKLFKELEKSQIKVGAVIDKNASDICVEELNIINPDGFIEGVDAVIVTVLDEYEEIKKRYEQEIPYISFEKVIEVAEELVQE